MTETAFFNISDDVVVHKIFFKLEDDPRDWARLDCVCTKFSSLIRNICWKQKCSRIICSDLLAASSTLPGGWGALYKLAVCCPGLLRSGFLLDHSDFGLGRELGPDENYQRPHVASQGWNFSRENGDKLLGYKFWGDCLYICGWPGCVHPGESRNYLLFRGVFRDFKSSSVWRAINDENKSKINRNCAFCSCKGTWDLRFALNLDFTSFCSVKSGYRGWDCLCCYDGELVVRAYVCENGHVSGASSLLCYCFNCFN